MKRKVSSVLSLVIATLMAVLLLKYPGSAMHFSLQALQLWFSRMIPALLPFMILSGLMLRMQISDRFAGLFSPVLRPVFHLSDSCLYVIVIGFFCGFPMGARACAESLRAGKITPKQAQLLLCFCNNIGPVYVTGYVHSLFPASPTAYVLIGLYGIPLLYGIILRYSIYRHDAKRYSPKSLSYTDSCLLLRQAALKESGEIKNCGFSHALHESILSSLDAITALGGYMIFCSLLNLLPYLLVKNKVILQLWACLIEITSGLSSGKTLPVWLCYTLLTFGGLSCFAQTASCIENTGLSLKNYMMHKCIQTILTGIYFYILFHRLLP